MRVTQPFAIPNRNTPAGGQWRWRMLLGSLVLLLAAAGLLRLAGGQAKARMTQQHPPPGRLVDVGGYSLHLDCRGHGSPTVLLEAGLNDFSVQWARVQPAVARFTRVCAYDRAGLGWSDPSPHPRTGDALVHELHTLLSRAGETGPYVLVGHSFGGVNLRRFARQYPAWVQGMVLVDSAHEAQGVRIPALRRAVEPLIRQFRLLALLNRWGLLALSPAQIPNRGLPEAGQAQYQARLAASSYFAGAIAESAAFAAGDLAAPAPPSLGALPLIVISRGRAEPLPGLVDGEQAQYEQSWRSLQSELAGLSSNSQAWVAARSGHDIHLQQPYLVVAAIRQFAGQQPVFWEKPGFSGWCAKGDRICVQPG